jgi:hypothetical protein
VLQDRQHKLPLVHAPAFVHIGEEVELALQLEHRAALGQHLAVLRESVDVVDRQTQQRGGDEDEEAQEDLGGLVFKGDVAIPNSL